MSQTPPHSIGVLMGYYAPSPSRVTRHDKVSHVQFNHHHSNTRQRLFPLNPTPQSDMGRMSRRTRYELPKEPKSATKNMTSSNLYGSSSMNYKFEPKFERSVVKKVTGIGRSATPPPSHVVIGLDYATPPQRSMTPRRYTCQTTEHNVITNQPIARSTSGNYTATQRRSLTPQGGGRRHYSESPSIAHVLTCSQKNSQSNVSTTSLVGRCIAMNPSSKGSSILGTTGRDKTKPVTRQNLRGSPYFNPPELPENMYKNERRHVNNVIHHDMFGNDSTLAEIHTPRNCRRISPGASSRGTLCVL